MRTILQRFASIARTAGAAGARRILRQQSILSTLVLIGILSLVWSDAAPADTITTLFNFPARTSRYPYPNQDGALPSGPLIQASDGDFYSTTSRGGANGAGTIFKVTSTGEFTLLHSFGAFNVKGRNKDGADPLAGLTQASDGNLYGVTFFGGAHGTGTIFQITLQGVFHTLHSFDAVSGKHSYPYANLGSLLQAKDGYLYGTTIDGGANNAGTIYRISTHGDYHTLYSFSALDHKGVNIDGANPFAGLIQGEDDQFYGVAAYGGAGGSGMVFQFTTSGVLKPLHSFDVLSRARTNTEGASPASALVQTEDGTLYGSTVQGGAFTSGTLFSITTTGVFTLLHTFSVMDANGANEDGAIPVGQLLPGIDGDLYGMANNGGVGTNGTIFKISTSGDFTLLYAFTQHSLPIGATWDGASPDAGLIQAQDGNFYAALSDGGSNNTGTIMRFGPVIHQISPPRIVANTALTIGIKGVGFLPGAVVAWNGVPLATHFINEETLTADVPVTVNGLLHHYPGKAAIKVTNPDGTNASSQLTIRRH